MLGISVIGSQKFIIGFQLAGIRNAFELDNAAGDSAYRKIREAMQMENAGILIAEEKAMNRLDEHDRSEIESSVKPVVIVLSEQASSDSLRKMIRKSIGIDLWG